MRIRQIMKEKGIGYLKAKKIHNELGNQVIYGRPPVEITQDEYDFMASYRNDFNVGIHRLNETAKRKDGAPQGLTEWIIYDYDNLHVRGEIIVKNQVTKIVM